MNKMLIDKFIAMPMAITVFKQDQKSFESFKIGNLYQDKLVDMMIHHLVKMGANGYMPIVWEDRFV